MTDHEAKLSEIRQRHEYKEGVRGTKNDQDNEAQTHADRATLLEIVAELESDAKHVRAINATLDESLTELLKEHMTVTARADKLQSELDRMRNLNRQASENMMRLNERADAAERALAEAREKVNGLAHFMMWGQPAQYFACSEVLAALGVES